MQAKVKIIYFFFFRWLLFFIWWVVSAMLLYNGAAVPHELLDPVSACRTHRLLCTVSACRIYDSQPVCRIHTTLSWFGVYIRHSAGLSYIYDTQPGWCSVDTMIQHNRCRQDHPYEMLLPPACGTTYCYCRQMGEYTFETACRHLRIMAKAMKVQIDWPYIGIASVSYWVTI